MLDFDRLLDFNRLLVSTPTRKGESLKTQRYKPSKETYINSWCRRLYPIRVTRNEGERPVNFIEIESNRLKKKDILLVYHL